MAGAWLLLILSLQSTVHKRAQTGLFHLTCMLGIAEGSADFGAE